MGTDVREEVAEVCVEALKEAYPDWSVSIEPDGRTVRAQDGYFNVFFRVHEESEESR